MRVPVIICSQSTSMDTHSGHLSLFHIIHSFVVTNLPGQIGTVHVSALLEPEASDPDEVQLGLSYRINDVEKMRLPLQISSLRPVNGGVNWNITQIGNLFVDTPGVLSFSILDKDENTLGKYEFKVVLLPSAPIASNLSAPADPGGASSPAGESGKLHPTKRDGNGRRKMAARRKPKQSD